MFQDEARFGRINDPKRCWSPKRTRPTVGKQIIREYTYAYGDISPRDGAADFLILPVMTAVAMKVFLDELASRHDCHYGSSCSTTDEALSQSRSAQHQGGPEHRLAPARPARDEVQEKPCTPANSSRLTFCCVGGPGSMPSRITAMTAADPVASRLLDRTGV